MGGVCEKREMIHII